MTIEQRVAVLEEIFSKLQDYYTSAYSGEEIDALLGKAGSSEQRACNPNLFINPLLQIWQQHPSGWSGVPVNRYVCDGWRVLSSNGDKTNNFTPAAPYGMANAAGGAACTISQFLENAAQFNGLQMTCSVLKITANGSQSFVTATKTASGWTDSTDILAFFGTSSEWRWINSGETLIGAKLEVGTQQTLAHQEGDKWVLNEVPNYGEQLARCQRYYQLYSTAEQRPAKAVDCRPTMRVDPSQGTITIDGTTYYYNTANL